MEFKPGRNINRDPFLSFRFKVEIEGIEIAGFNEATGLNFETEIEKFREGGFNVHERQLIGPSKCPERLILKRGLSGDAKSNQLWDWYKKVLAGNLERKQLSIQMLDYSGAAISQLMWVFEKACPVKWTGPQFRAGTAEIAFETIEFIHRGMKI
jgi:phage tail-like protein